MIVDVRCAHAPRPIARRQVGFPGREGDPTTLALVVMTIVVVASAACWLPAWRASRLDPNAVLRNE